jgi:hypothetical protein
MTISAEEIRAASERAQNAFWASVAESFPGMPGDFAPEWDAEFDVAAMRAVSLWLGASTALGVSVKGSPQDVAAIMTDDLPPGQGIQFAEDVDRYPDFVIPRGTSATVVKNNILEGGIISFSVDRVIPGMEPWDNLFYLMFDDITDDNVPRFYLLDERGNLAGDVAQVWGPEGFPHPLAGEWPGTRNAPRARRNFERDQHRTLERNAAEAAYYADQAADTYRGSTNSMDVGNKMYWRAESERQRGRAGAHLSSTGEQYRSALATSRRDIERPKEVIAARTKTRGKPNPPFSYEPGWHRVTGESSGQLYELMADNSDFPVASIYKYQPRKSPQTAWVAGRYETSAGRKVPKGTKWLVLYRYGGVTAHKTLKAAKKGAQEKTGAAANKPRKRRKARANGSAFTVKVKRSAKARTESVRLPAAAKAQKVNKRVIHRSVSYRGGKFRLLKGWTVSNSTGLALGKYKTKAAAVARAKR